MKYFNIILLFLFLFDINAQKLRVIYRFEYLPLREDYSSELRIFSQNSEFEIFEKNLIEKTNLSNLDSVNISLNDGNDLVIKEDVYFNRLVLKNFNLNNVELFKPSVLNKQDLIKIVDEEKLVWRISNESMKILGYECFKAEGIFKDRKYEVWYAPELKHSDGPWKFRGLPGLILKLNSVDNKLKIEASKVIFEENLKSKNQEYFKITKENYSWIEYLKVCKNQIKKIKNSLKNNELEIGEFQSKVEIMIQEPDFIISDK
jgi:GLPGLI family protein